MFLFAWLLFLSVFNDALSRHLLNQMNQLSNKSKTNF